MDYVKTDSNNKLPIKRTMSRRLAFFLAFVLAMAVIPGGIMVQRIMADDTYNIYYEAHWSYSDWSSHDISYTGLYDYTFYTGLYAEDFIPMSGGFITTPMVAARAWSSLALHQDGTVWIWGNAHQLPGPVIRNIIPVQKMGLYDIKAISNSYSSSLALRNDGTIWGWGHNEFGVLGDGTTDFRPYPVQVQNLTDVIAITQGASVSMALRSDGTVWAWGDNGFGQLGDGTTNHSLVPVQVQNLTNIVAISAGLRYGLALRDDGTIWGWGSNDFGQLSAAVSQTSVPVQAQNINNVVAIASYSNSRHTMALRYDGTVWAWGENTLGVLGDGTTTHRFSPVQVQNLDNVAGIAAGRGFGAAVREDGTVWAWGHNNFGQLGDGTTDNRLTPVQVQNLTNIVSIAAGREHGLAIASNGDVWGWGSNRDGQAGDGIPAPWGWGLGDNNRTRAIRVVNAGGVGFLNLLGNVTTLPTPPPPTVITPMVAAGSNSTTALRYDGTVWGWGSNGSGQLGDGTHTTRPAPVQAQNITDVARIAVGSHHTVALRTDGTVWTWGSNFNHQIADGTRTSRTTPFQVPNIDNIVAIAVMSEGFCICIGR